MRGVGKQTWIDYMLLVVIGVCVAAVAIEVSTWFYGYPDS